MTVSLTKQERKYIATAVIHNWTIQYVGFRGNACWDGDPLLPVKVGAVCKSLINKGLLEEFARDRYIRKSSLADKYECKNLHCRGGRIEVYDEDEDEYDIKGACSVCDGIGVLDKPFVKKRQAKPFETKIKD